MYVLHEPGEQLHRLVQTESNVAELEVVERLSGVQAQDLQVQDYLDQTDSWLDELEVVDSLTEVLWLEGPMQELLVEVWDLDVGFQLVLVGSLV